MDKLKFYGYQKQKNKLRKLFLMLSVGILCFAMTGQAFAGCDDPNHLLTKEWRKMVWKSSDATLRDIYNDNNRRCEYILGPHEGGTIPHGVPSNPKPKHVTVIAFGYGTCHVFNHLNADGYITTCERFH